MQIWNSQGEPAAGLWSTLGLARGEPVTVTLVGGGGKTSLMLALAQEAARQGMRVAVTTTTHIQAPKKLPLARGPEELGELLAGHPIVVCGVPCAGDKLAPVGGLERCREKVDMLLMEGDGAARLPLKAPADHEPVIPPWTDAVLAVAGLDALDKPIQEICHRPQRVAELLGRRITHRVSGADVARLLTRPEGGRKGVPDRAVFRLVLNKADTESLRRAGVEILARTAEWGILTQFEKEERGGACWY